MTTEKVETNLRDRSQWKEGGSWKNEPADKVTWKTRVGLPGMIVRSFNGAWCGYVGVTRAHPWFEKPYQELEREMDLDVHGGLTYSKQCSGVICHVPEPGESGDVWWFGFDCNHSSEWFASYRSEAFVRREVEWLAKQIAERKSVRREL